MADKLTRAQREQIIFAHLKGQDDPLYEVIETKHGKYIVKPKHIELEEEEAEEESEDDLPPPPPKKVEKTSKQERRSIPASQTSKHRTKQDARRLLDALTSIINSDDSSSESEEYQQAPTLIEPNNFKPTTLNFKRRRLAF